MDSSPSQAASQQLCSAFAGQQRIASGGLRHVASQAKQYLDAQPQAALLIFDNLSSELVEVDFRGSLDDVLARLPAGEATPAAEAAESKPRGRGRPRLGVLSREVTLLPRHWDWLRKQPGGASVALRKLVEQARRDNEAVDRQRDAQQALHRFMTAMAGELPNYEEALRALYAGDADRFQRLISEWPRDLEAHVRKLALPAFAG